VLGGGNPSSREPEEVDRPTPTASGTTTEVAGISGIPDSSWTRVLTRAQAERAGISEANIVEHVGTDDRMPLTFQLLSDSYSLLVSNDEGVDELGDPGSVEYPAPRRLVLTSDSPGCPGCREELTWDIRGDRLTLRLAPGENMPRLDAFIWLGDWRRAD